MEFFRSGLEFPASCGWGLGSAAQTGETEWRMEDGRIEIYSIWLWGQSGRDRMENGREENRDLFHMVVLMDIRDGPVTTRDGSATNVRRLRDGW